MLASLSHPNIARTCVSALVMELVPGERLKRSLPLLDVLQCARQIAEALDAAPERAVGHRDWKPASAIVMPQGVAKLLDFGIAAVAQGPNPALAGPSQSATRHPFTGLVVRLRFFAESDCWTPQMLFVIMDSGCARRWT